MCIRDRITSLPVLRRWPFDTDDGIRVVHIDGNVVANNAETCLLYTSDAADERSSVDLGGRRIIKKKKKLT